MQIINGDRIGRQGRIRLGCSAVLFNKSRNKVLLTRRTDNGQWCLPSGGVEAGESVSEACIRETREETGLIVNVERLTSVFSSPDRLVIYDDGNQFQIITLNFEVRLLGGEPILSDETTEIGYFPIHDIESMDMLLHHRQFIMDTLGDQNEVFIR